METKNKFFYLFPDGIYESKEEKPVREDFQTLKGRDIKNTDTNVLCFDFAVEQWLLSCVKYKFGEGEGNKLIDFIYREMGHKSFIPPEAIQALNSGIKIDSERVRIGKSKRCANSCDWPKCTFSDCFEKNQKEWRKADIDFAYFVPIEDKPKEESNYRQKLFSYMHDQHGVMLLESDMDEIENIINPKKYPYTF